MSASRQIHLAAHFPGVNNTTVWSDPEAGSHIEFSSFVHMAQTAERAKFDFFFLAEGLRLREQGGRIYDLDVMGRPDTFTVLSALAAGYSAHYARAKAGQLLNTPRVRAVLEELLHEIEGEAPFDAWLRQQPQVLGVTQLTDVAQVIRIAVRVRKRLEGVTRRRSRRTVREAAQHQPQHA